MNKNLPYYLIGVRLALDGILSIGRRFAPDTLGGKIPQGVGIVLGGVLLSAAILIGMVSAVTGVYRRRNALAMIIALLMHGSAIGFYLFAATGTAEVSSLVPSTLTPEKLAVLAAGAPKAHGREMAARLAFTEFGERLRYVDDSGNLRSFEPTPADSTKREHVRQMQVDGAKTLASLRGQALIFRSAALVNFLSLVGVLLVGAVMLGGPTKWHGWLTRR